MLHDQYERLRGFHSGDIAFCHAEWWCELELIHHYAVGAYSSDFSYRQRRSPDGVLFSDYVTDGRDQYANLGNGRDIAGLRSN